MIYIVVLGVVLLCVIVSQDVSVYAQQQQQQQQQTEQYNMERPCHINVQFNQYPVYHNHHKRLNPDGTAYPGDAIHYIFSFRGSDTCSRFGPTPIQSQGAIDMISHNTTKIVIHPHQDFEMVPKNLTTTHYYKILDTDTRCTVHAGGTRIHVCMELYKSTCAPCPFHV